MERHSEPLHRLPPHPEKNSEHPYQSKKFLQAISSVGTLHYLNWDREQSNTGPATDLFHRLHGLDNEIPGEVRTDFESLYREVAEVETDDPEEVFRFK